MEETRILNIRAFCRHRLEAVILILHRWLGFAEAAVIWGAFLRHARMCVLAMAAGVSQGKRNEVKSILMLILSQPLTLVWSKALDLILVVLLMRVCNAIARGVSNHKRGSVILSSIQLLVD